MKNHLEVCVKKGKLCCDCAYKIQKHTGIMLPYSYPDEKW